MDESTAAILVIGDEILSGKTEEANARFLIKELRSLGVALKRIMVVSDDVNEIAPALAELSQRFTYVFTSGGVGPTHDDVTLAGVCQAFNCPMHRDEQIETMIRNYFGDKIKASHLRMADVPLGSHFITTESTRWPILSFNNVYILPGVPEFFREKFLAIKERFRATSFHLKLIFTHQDEFAIATQMQQVANDFPLVAIGSYPAFDRDDYRVKITIESKDADSVQSAFEALKSSIDQSMIVRCE